MWLSPSGDPRKHEHRAEQERNTNGRSRTPAAHGIRHESRTDPSNGVNDDATKPVHDRSRVQLARVNAAMALPEIISEAIDDPERAIPARGRKAGVSAEVVRIQLVSTAQARSATASPDIAPKRMPASASPRIRVTSVTNVSARRSSVVVQASPRGAMVDSL